MSLNFYFCSSAARFAFTFIKVSFKDRDEPDVDDLIECLDLRDDFDPTDKVSSFSSSVFVCRARALLSFSHASLFFFVSATITKERTYLMSSVGCSAASRSGHILWLG